MFSLQCELCLRQVPRRERRQVGRTEPRELDQQVIQRGALALAELGEPVERREPAVGTVLEEDPRTRDPVGTFAVDQVPHDYVGAPRVGTFGPVGPLGLQSAEHRPQYMRSAFEDRAPRRQFELHDASSAGAYTTLRPSCTEDAWGTRGSGLT